MLKYNYRKDINLHKMLIVKANVGIQNQKAKN